MTQYIRHNRLRLDMSAFVHAAAALTRQATPAVGAREILFNATSQTTANTSITPPTLLKFDLTDPPANTIADAAVHGSVEVRR